MNFTFATIVTKDYQKYIPLFCYFFFRNYPDEKVHLFLMEKIEPEIKALLPYCGAENGNGTIQIDYTYKDYPKTNQELKSIRWILGIDDFREDVYIGDIDILLLDKDIPKVHTDHCLKNGLTYSNMVRPNSKRLTGLQYCKFEYFYDMMEVHKKHSKLLKDGKLKLNDKYRNEHLLHDMVVERYGVDGLPKDDYRPHHGLHLGIWRKGCQPKPLLVMDMKKRGYGLYYDEFLTIKRTEKIASFLMDKSKLVEVKLMQKWMFENQKYL